MSLKCCTFPDLFFSILNYMFFAGYSWWGGGGIKANSFWHHNTNLWCSGSPCSTRFEISSVAFLSLWGFMSPCSCPNSFSSCSDKNHGVILLPEGLIESIPEVYALLKVTCAKISLSPTRDNFPMTFFFLCVLFKNHYTIRWCIWFPFAGKAIFFPMVIPCSIGLSL